MTTVSEVAPTNTILGAPFISLVRAIHAEFIRGNMVFSYVEKYMYTCMARETVFLLATTRTALAQSKSRRFVLNLILSNTSHDQWI